MRSLPLSDHDLHVIGREIAIAFVRENFKAEEIVVPARRVNFRGSGLRLLDLPVRLSDELSLNSGMLVQFGREPWLFDFEPRTEASE